MKQVLQSNGSVQLRPAPLVGHNSTHANLELEQEASRALEVLFEANTVFPFVLFPDTVSIDRVKVTVTRRLFFQTAQVISIQIEDVLNVEANTGPFFGSLKIWTRFFNKKPLMVSWLSRQDAIKIKTILQGYSIARNKQIDTTNVPVDELVALLARLGEDGA